MESHFRRTGVALRRALQWTAVVAIALLATAPLLAQSAAHIDGTVTDQTGAVVAGAKVTALNLKTQEKKTATASGQGIFSVTDVAPGIYDITIEAANFQKEVIQSVEINVGQAFTANVKLQVGAASETVEVKATEVQVQTTDAQLSNAITMREIDTLPSLGRTPVTLAVFQPGVQVNPGDTSFSRVNGQRQGSNNSTLDGIDVNDSVVPRLGLSLTSNNTDSVQEFRIVTEGGKAEYGRNAGAQVEMITRSGSNDFHGNAFDYLRNTDLNANDWFNNQSGSDRPKFIQNIFGGSFGGPIKHNRTFVFGNYQGRRTRQEVVRNRTIFSDNARNGLFTYVDTTGATRTFSIVNQDPRGIGIDPKVAPLIALVPHCNNTDIGDKLNTCGFRFNNPNNSYEDQFTIRGDQVITSTHKAFLRWSWQRNSSIDALNNADATYPGQVPGTQGGHRWGFSVGDDWAFTPTLVNSARVGYQSAQVSFNRPARLQGPTYITNLLNPDPVSSAYAQGRNSPVTDIIDSMTMMHGNHTFKWGGRFSHTKQVGTNDGGVWFNVTTSATSNGNTPPIPAFAGGLCTSTAGCGSGLSFSSTGQQTTYQSLYNDLLGRMDSVAHTFLSTDLSTFQPAGQTRSRDHILNEHGYFVQDDWRMRRNLTVSLGLRWELFLPPVEADGIQAGVIGAAQLLDPANSSTALTLQKGGWYNTDWNNFAPRVGIAWDPRGDGKTAVRANWGVFYDRIIGATVSAADGNTPGFATGASSTPQTLTAAALSAAGCGSAPVGDVRFNDCVPLPAQPALTLTPPVTNRSNTITLFNPNLATGYVESYSLNVQHEVARNTTVEVAYVGARGIKLFMQRDLNQMKTGGQFLNDFLAMQAFNNGGKCAGSTPVCGPAPAASNTFVQIFGTGQNALSKLGASNFTNGAIGTVASNLDRGFNNLYAAAGLPQTFLRNYPQFAQVQYGTNDGRNYYDSLQITVRRSAGALRTQANYTFGKSIDNISVDANGFTSPIDNTNVRLNRALSDADHRNSFNMSFIYTLPVGTGKMLGRSMPKWLDTLVGGWDVGSLLIAQDGVPFTVSSLRSTFVGSCSATGTCVNSWADFAGGPHDIGEPRYVVDPKTGKTNVFLFTPAQAALFTFPAAGTVGTSGRNGFRGPKYFDVDMSLVKRFKVTERQSFTFRAEAYNALNNPNWTNPSVSLNSSSTFGQIGGTTGPAGTSNRTMQLSLRYDF